MKKALASSPSPGSPGLGGPSLGPPGLGGPSLGPPGLGGPVVAAISGLGDQFWRDSTTDSLWVSGEFCY